MSNDPVSVSLSPDGVMDVADAKRLDQRIRLLFTDIFEKVDKLYELIDQAQRGEIHKALGFPSWPAYVADVAKIQTRLSRDQRREVNGRLSSKGMSQRVIADLVGVDPKTISNDLRRAAADRGGENSPPGFSAEFFIDAEEQAAIMSMSDVSEDDFEDVLVEAREQGDLSRDNVVALCQKKKPLKPTRTIGVDGKSYPRPAQGEPHRPPRKPRQTPIDRAMRTAVYDLDKVMGRVARLVDDDRFKRNRELLAADNHGDLDRMRRQLEEIIAKLRPADPERIP